MASPLASYRAYGRKHPNEPIAIDWTNPICKNLKAAIAQNGSQIYDYASKKLPASGSGTRTSKGSTYGRTRRLDAGSDFFETQPELDASNVATTGYTVLVWAKWENYVGWFYSGIFAKNSDLSTGEGYQTYKGGGDGVSSDLLISHDFAGSAVLYTAAEVESGEPLCWSWDGTNAQPWVGATKKSAVAFSTSTGASGAGYLKVGSNRDTHDSEGDHYLTLVWNRVLTDAEVLALVDKPFRVFRPANSPLYYLPAASGAFTLVADAGSYSYGGTDASLLLGALLGADSGSYSYSGTAADLNKGYYLSGDSGSYTYTGADAALTFAGVGAFTLTADSGAYSYSGAVAALEAGFVIGADSGSYAYSGTNATLTRNIPLSADSGSYAYTGTNVDFSLAAKLTAESGSYTYTGANATITSSGQVWVVQSDDISTWTLQSDDSSTWTIE